MRERKRQIFLILIMTTVSLIVAGITIGILYNTAFEEERERLVETAQSQARLIEAVARFDALYSKGDFPGSPTAATLSQITDAHGQYKGFGETGEFTLARREGDNIVFLLRHRHSDLDKPKPVALDSKLAEPMRRALSGLSGTVVGLDYRGKMVLAAYEPVSELDFGIVAKIDLTEIRAPFVKAGIIAMCAAFLVVLVGVFLFYRVSNPIIRHLEERRAELVRANEKLKREVEERKLADEALQQHIYFLQTLIDTIPSPVFYKDTNGVYQGCNLAFETYLGLSKEEIIGRTVYELAPKDLADKYYEMDSALFSQPGVQVYEGPVQYSDGTIHEVIFHKATFSKLGDTLGGLVGIMLDITERKQAEEELQKAHDELEQGVRAQAGRRKNLESQSDASKCGRRHFRTPAYA